MFTVAILTLSDKGSRGEREDKSGPVIAEMLDADLYEVVHTAILPDEKHIIESNLKALCDAIDPVNLILTTGGTGFSPRDVTPEAAILPALDHGLEMLLSAGSAECAAPEK